MTSSKIKFSRNVRAFTGRWLIARSLTPNFHMELTPEQKARVKIDSMLDKTGWEVQDVSLANIHAKQGVAIREFPLEKNTDGRWRAFEYEELINRDKASLDLFWLKDESLEDSENLPNPDILAQEIVEDLEAALEQFRQIAEDLNSDVTEL